MTDAPEPIDLAALGVRRAGATPEVRDLLREVVARSEADGALGVAVTLVLADGSVATAFVIGERWAALLGGVATLQARVTAHGMEP